MMLRILISLSLYLQVINSLRIDEPRNGNRVVYIPRDRLPELRRRLEGTSWIISSVGNEIDTRRLRPRTRPSSTTLKPAVSQNPRRRRVKPTQPPSTTKPPVVVTSPTREGRRTPGTRRRTTPNHIPRSTTTQTTTIRATYPSTTRPVRRTRTTVTTSSTERSTTVWRHPVTTPRSPTTTSRFTTRRTTTHLTIPTTRVESRTRPTTPKPPTTPFRRHRPRYPTAKPTFNPRKITKATDYSSTTESNEVVPPVNTRNGTSETPFTDNCLECICYGSSGCNFDIDYKCYGEDECGPYKIDYAYWYEAGYPGYKGNNEDFHTCAKDRSCAEKAVREYLKINAMDCNNDGGIDCMDYAAIHKAGPESCAKNWVYESKFWSAFSECAGFDEKSMYQKEKR